MYLNEIESKKLLQKYGIKVTEAFPAYDINEALKIAKTLGYPVVLKVVSNKIIHKSEVKGVILNIKDESELKLLFHDTLKRMKEIDPQAYLSIQKQFPKGVELVVGISEDASFGSVIMFGLGGIFIEVLKDVSFRLIPLSKTDAWDMINEIKAKKILEGVRGLPKVDKEKLVEFIMKIAEISEKEFIKEMDLNPIFAYEKEIVVIDARIIK